MEAIAIRLNDHEIPLKQTKRQIFFRLPWIMLAFNVLILSFYFSYNSDSVAFANLALDSDYFRQAYRWWTYCLFHLSPMHIGTNMMSWTIYASMTEWDHGHWRLLVLQILCAIGGAFGFGWEIRFLKESGIIVAGLSGSIYGILACQLGNIVLNWSSWEFFRRLWYTSLLIGATVADIIVDIVMYSPDISYSDHVGGFITGACAGFVVMGTCKMSKWKKEIEIVSVVLFAMYFVAGMVNILIT